MISKEQKEIIIEKLLPYHPSQIGIFGSYSRNENSEKSDLDILVSFNGNPTLFDLMDMEDKISSFLGIKIDLVTEKSMHPKLKPYIDKDLQIIYG